MACIAACYVLLATAAAWTRLPWCDEGVFGSPAYTLMTKHYMGTTVFESKGTVVPGIEQYTYWVMPLYLITLAAWFKVAGASLIAMRMLSLLWGAIALAAWYGWIRRLGVAPRVGLLAIGLVAVDLSFQSQASTGRMDMMAVALNACSLLAYVNERRRSVGRALLISNTLVALSAFTHPNGGLTGFAMLAVLVLYFDRRAVKVKYLPIIAVPYLIGFAAWGLYIAQAPNLFREQFFNNAQGRFDGLLHPLDAIRREFTDRYFQYFGLYRQGVGKFKSLILIWYALAITGALYLKPVRNSLAGRVVLMCTTGVFCVLAFLEFGKYWLYIVHITPLVNILGAMVVAHLWQSRHDWRWAVALTVLAFLMVQVAGVGYWVYDNAYERRYGRLIQAIRAHSTPGTVLIGPAELGFALGFDSSFRDDCRLGYNSGLRADLIVMDGRYGVDFQKLRIREPQVAAYIENLLRKDYRLVAEFPPDYRLYAASHGITEAQQPGLGQEPKYP